MVTCLNKTEFQQKTPKIITTDIAWVFHPLLLHPLSLFRSTLAIRNPEVDQYFEILVF